MGSIFLVEHRITGRQFVAKVIHATASRDDRAADRFRIEAQSLGVLSHPRIVSVEGWGQTSDGRPFLVLEYLKGRTLSEELRARTLTEAEALTIACQILEAVQAAHDQGIVHRDLKPSNVFLCAHERGEPKVKVLDFGLAKLLPQATGSIAPLLRPTSEGTLVGTPSYLSPEAIRGDLIDHRADIYAVGVMLFRMLAGHGPFDHLGQGQQMAGHLSHEAEPLHVCTNGRVAPSLSAKVARALRKDPAARFSSAESFRRALLSAEPPFVPAPPEPVPRERCQDRDGVAVERGSMEKKREAWRLAAWFAVGLVLAVASISAVLLGKLD